MQGRCSEPISRAECTHCETIDVQEGERVCLLCGLVVEQLFRHERENERRDEYDSKSSEVYIFLRDVCDKATIPNFVLSYTLSYFRALKVDFKKQDKKFSDKVIVAYALYETLSRHEIPRLLEDIAYYTNIPSKTLSKLLSYLNFPETLNNPKEFVDRYCSLLGLKYYDAKIIKGIVQSMCDESNIRPNTMVATIIYLYCQECDVKVSMKSICEVCSVSSGNVYRTIRNFKDDFSRQIKFSCV